MKVYESYSKINRKNSVLTISKKGYSKFQQGYFNESVFINERNDSSPDSFEGNELKADDSLTQEFPAPVKINDYTKYKKPQGLKFLNKMKKIFDHSKNNNLEDYNDQLPISWSSVYKKIFNRNYDEKLNMDEIELRFRSIFDTLDKANKDELNLKVDYSMIKKISRSLNNYDDDHKNDIKVPKRCIANVVKKKPNQTEGSFSHKYVNSIRKFSENEPRNINITRPPYTAFTFKKLKSIDEQRKGSFQPILRASTILTFNDNPQKTSSSDSHVASGTTHNTTNKDKAVPILETKFFGKCRGANLKNVSSSRNSSLLDYICSTAEKLNSHRDKLLSQDQRRLLNDHCFIKKLSKTVLEDLENIKHQITTYEKEQNITKNMFKNQSVRGLEHFFCFDIMRNEIQITISKFQKISKEKIERQRCIIDKIINILNSRCKHSEN